MQNKIQKTELLLFFIGLVMALIGIYYLGPSLTGFVIKEVSYADGLNLMITSSGNYTFQLQDIGELKSVKLDGKVTNYGRARVYIESDNARYLIFDSYGLNKSEQNKTNETNLITAFAIKEDDKSKKEKNKKPYWSSEINELIINGTTEINLSQYFTDNDEDELIYSISDIEGLAISINNEIATINPASNMSFNTTATFTASDRIDSKSHIVNLIVMAEEEQAENATNLSTSENITLIVPEQTTPEKIIDINLSYKPGTIYDANDNGEETIHGVVDLSVEATKFNWNADESKLCTRWEIYNVEDATLTKLCNGNSNCCSFVGLLPSKSNWSEIYYSAFGKDNAGHNNIVSAQVIYYDVNLSIELNASLRAFSQATTPKSEIYNSNWSNLSVKFFEDETEFFGECVDTCALNGLNKSSYTLIFEIENDAVLRLDKIRYNLLSNVKNKAPLLLQNFSTINVQKNENATINLSKYFGDEDGDVLHYDYYKTDNITILFSNNTAIIIPDRDFEGTRVTYISANDSENSAASDVFIINVTSVGRVPTINLSAQGLFEVRTKLDERLAVIDSFGNLNIKGKLIENTSPFADENDFVIQVQGITNAVITNPEGSMLIKGSLSENNATLTPTPNSFIIQNKNNEIVAYVNSTGSLFLKGTLTENVLFG